jgi:hypothetical protein
MPVFVRRFVMPLDLTTPVPYQVLVNCYSICLQAKIPAVLIGEPGQGKTSLNKAIGRVLGWPTETFPVPGKRSYAEIVGLPDRGSYGKGEDPYVMWLPYQYLVRLKQAERGIFFLDDLAEADMNMQSTYLSIISDQRFGDLYLPHISMAAAANPEDGKLKVRPAMKNRVVHLPAVMSTDDFAALLRRRQGRQFPDPEIPRLDARWEEKYLLARNAQIAAFLEQTPDFRHPDTDPNALAAEMLDAFPSPRTWDYVTLALAAYDGAFFRGTSLDDKNALATLVKGCIGDVAACAFWTWLAEDQLPNAEEILSNPEKALGEQKAFTTRKDRLYVMLSVMTRYLMRHADDAEKWCAGWKVLGLVAKKRAKPFGVPAALALYQNRPEGVDDPQELLQYADILAASA